MIRKIHNKYIPIVLIIVLLLIITITGVLSFDTTKSFFITNQYGHQVELFGSGIYARDSYFRAPIFMGTDFTMLFLVIPLFLIGILYDYKKDKIKSKVFISSLIAVVLYYSASISFGVIYNAFHLLYIALFGLSLFTLVYLIRDIEYSLTTNNISKPINIKGINIFLILSGISLFIAWLPDIIPTLITNETLSLIEVYTTEITYVIDMGIISPLMFICLFLLKKGKSLGTILLDNLLTLCIIMGVILPIQTIFQILAGIFIPLPVLIIKVGIFVLLASFALYFKIKLTKQLK